MSISQQTLALITQASNDYTNTLEAVVAAQDADASATQAAVVAQTAHSAAVQAKTVSDASYQTAIAALAAELGQTSNPHFAASAVTCVGTNDIAGRVASQHAVPISSVLPIVQGIFDLLKKFGGLGGGSGHTGTHGAMMPPPAPPPPFPPPGPIPPPGPFPLPPILIPPVTPGQPPIPAQPITPHGLLQGIKWQQILKSVLQEILNGFPTS
jgi:hypothetical protein